MWTKEKSRFTELTDRFITRKTIFVCCSQKAVLRGRTTAPLNICLRGQVFVRVETSRSHLAWPTDDRNLTDFLVIWRNLSNRPCSKAWEFNNAKVSLTWSPESRRRRGRPKTTWRRTVESEWRRLGFISWTQIEQVAKERTKWKELTCGLTHPPWGVTRTTMIKQTCLSFISSATPSLT